MSELKQYVVINTSLGMSKGKIARICVTAGVALKYITNFWQRLNWLLKSRKTIVVKYHNIDYLIDWLEFRKIKYIIHKDTGLTQVPEGSICMVTFMFDDDKSEFIKNLKLY